MLKILPEAYLEPCHISKMEPFVKIGKGFQPLAILAKGPILDVDWVLNIPLPSHTYLM